MEVNLYEMYDSKFYLKHIDGMLESSGVMLKILYEYYQPKTLIDIGCGQGVWLATAEKLGAEYLVGVDGAWVNKNMLLSKNIIFIPINIEESLPSFKEKYDLCISLEVAEHLSFEKSKEFIEFLCDLSDVILFSAAIKHQGGDNHVNEQWQSYWIERFRDNNYEYVDLFRSRVWENESVKWWYKQNTFLFLKKDTLKLDFNYLKSLEKPILNIVHPLNYLNKI